MTDVEITDGGDESGAEAPPETPEGPTEGQAVPWEEYVKLRNENADYRKKWQPYEKTFSSPQAEQFKAAAEAYASGDMDALTAWFARNTATALGVDPEVLMALAEGDDDAEEELDEEGELSQETIERLIDEKVQESLSQRDQSLIQQQASEVEQAAVGMGYEVGTRDYINLLHVAVHETGGDLQAAEDQIKAEKQAIIDEYLKGKREEARGTPKQTAGQAPGSARKVTMDNAADAALEYLEQHS